MISTGDGTVGYKVRTARYSEMCHSEDTDFFFMRNIRSSSSSENVNIPKHLS